MNRHAFALALLFGIVCAVCADDPTGPPDGGWPTDPTTTPVQWYCCIPACDQGSPTCADTRCTVFTKCFSGSLNACWGCGPGNTCFTPSDVSWMKLTHWRPYWICKDAYDPTATCNKFNGGWYTCAAVDCYQSEDGCNTGVYDFLCSLWIVVSNPNSVCSPTVGSGGG